MPGIRNKSMSIKRHTQGTGVQKGSQLGQNNSGNAGLRIFGLAQDQAAGRIREKIQAMAVDGQEIGGNRLEKSLRRRIVLFQLFHDFLVVFHIVERGSPRSGLAGKEESVGLISHKGEEGVIHCIPFFLYIY